MIDRVEVASWRKPRRSDGGANGANCVEAGTWRKSSRSGSSGNGDTCVEVGSCGAADHGVAVRDTKYRSGGALACDRADWAGLLTAVRRGDLDPA